MKTLICTVSAMMIALPLYANSESRTGRPADVKAPVSTENVKSSSNTTKSKIIEKQEEVDSAGTVYPASDSTRTTTKEVKRKY